MLLTKEQLAEIAERAEKATPGPWRDDVRVFECGVIQEGDPAAHLIPVGKCDDCGKGPLIASREADGKTWHRHMIEPVPYDASHWEEAEERQRMAWLNAAWHTVFSSRTGDTIVGGYDYEEGGVASTKEDADFIARARSDVPALLAHIAELEEQLHPKRYHDVDAFYLDEEDKP